MRWPSCGRHGFQAGADQEHTWLGLLVTRPRAATQGCEGLELRSPQPIISPRAMSAASYGGPVPTGLIFLISEVFFFDGSEPWSFSFPRTWPFHLQK